MYHLSKPQQAIFEMDQFVGGSVANIAGDLLFENEYDTEKMKRICNQFLEMHPVFKTKIVLEYGLPMQWIDDSEEIPVPVIEFDRIKDYYSWASLSATDPMDIFGQLCFITVCLIEEKGIFIYTKLHHIIGDAWSLGIMANHFKNLYKGEVIERFSYNDYLLKEHEYLKSDQYAKDKKYWFLVYENQSEINYLCEKNSRLFKAKRKSVEFSKDLSDKIREYCKNKNISEFILFLSIIAAYYYRITGRNNFYIGTPILNRSGKKEKNTVGTYINTIPVAVKVSEEEEFSGLAHKLALQIMSSFRRQRFLYSDILKALRTEKDIKNTLFDVMVSFQNMKIEEYETNWYYQGMQAESLQIHIDNRDNTGYYHINYDYMTEKFTEKDIDALHSHVETILRSIVLYGQEPIGSLKMITEEEYQKVVYDFNNTKVDYLRDKCINELFEEQAAQNMDRVAVVFENEEYTYKQINEMSNSLAHILRERGVGREDIVAIISKRSYKVIVAQLAVLKAGGAYMPIDPNYPKERIDFMLSDTGCKVSLALDVQADNDVVLDMNDESIFSKNINRINNVNSAKDACYCIYTSGSTGKPKGTILTHKNVNNYCYKHQNNIVSNIIKDNFKTIVSITTIGFDIYLTESLLPLLNGLTVIYANEVQANSQSELNKLVCRYQAEVIQTTPSKLCILMSEPEETEYLKVLKAIIVGGEKLESIIVRKIRQYTEAKVFNIYGPTETTVWSTNTEVIKEEDIHIGKPIANTQIYIVDKHYNPVPIGCIGELCIAGDGVGRGYLNRPDLTAEKFVENPFGKGKMYKTGDLARWRGDGNIEYIGRNDFQVKIRGLRIELGEIENAIAEYDGINQAVVVEQKDENGRQYICAYYIGDEINIKVLKTELGKRLPQYMIPHFVMKMKSFPVTSSGKIDRKAFPNPDFESTKSNVEFVAPLSEKEKILVKTIEEVLDIHQVGVLNNFFDIGGDSLKAIEFVSKVNRLGLMVSLQNVFDYPTVRDLCDFIESSEIIENKVSCKHRVEYDDVLNRNMVDLRLPTQYETLGNVLLTGVTGYLGAHILYEFLEKETGKVYCLVRAKTFEEAIGRMRNLLAFYYDGKYIDEINKRIKIIIGDLTDKDCLEQISDEINTIIHSAASVKHYGSYDYFYKNNVKTTENLLNYARKRNIKFIHISSLSISGDDLFDQYGFIRAAEAKYFTEKHYYIGQDLSNVYVRSKFEAEQLVLESIRKGLKACIIRMGGIGNRSYDGKFQINVNENAFAKRIKFFMDIKSLPDYLDNMLIDLLPVDYCAKAVITIAQHINDGYSVFHCNYKTPIHRFIGLLKETHNIEFEIVDEETFLDKVKKRNYDSIMNDFDKNFKLLYDVNILVKNDFTYNYLKHHGLDLNCINADYIKKYLDYFIDIGFIEI